MRVCQSLKLLAAAPLLVLLAAAAACDNPPPGFAVAQKNGEVTLYFLHCRSDARAVEWIELHDQASGEIIWRIQEDVNNTALSHEFVISSNAPPGYTVTRYTRDPRPGRTYELRSSTDPSVNWESFDFDDVLDAEVYVPRRDNITTAELNERIEC